MQQSSIFDGLPRDVLYRLAGTSQAAVESQQADSWHEIAEKALQLAERASAKASLNQGRKRGRPSDTDHAKDARAFDAWEYRGRKGKPELARELGWSVPDLNKALDRHRQRVKRASSSLDK